MSTYQLSIYAPFPHFGHLSSRIFLRTVLSKEKKKKKKKTIVLCRKKKNLRELYYHPVVSRVIGRHVRRSGESNDKGNESEDG